MIFSKNIDMPFASSPNSLNPSCERIFLVFVPDLFSITKARLFKNCHNLGILSTCALVKEEEVDFLPK